MKGHALSGGLAELRVDDVLRNASDTAGIIIHMPWHLDEWSANNNLVGGL